MLPSFSVIADEAVGTVIRLSAFRGADAVGHWPIPTTIIGNGDSYQINADHFIIKRVHHVEPSNARTDHTTSGGVVSRSPQ